MLFQCFEKPPTFYIDFNIKPTFFCHSIENSRIRLGVQVNSPNIQLNSRLTPYNERTNELVSLTCDLEPPPLFDCFEKKNVKMSRKLTECLVKAHGNWYVSYF